MKGQLLALAAAARFARTRETDEKIEKRITEAIDFSSDDPYVAEVIIFINQSLLNQRILPDVSLK